MWYVLGVLELKKPIPCEKVIIIENDVPLHNLSLPCPFLLSYLLSEDKEVKQIKLFFLLCAFFFPNGEREYLLKGFVKRK